MPVTIPSPHKQINFFGIVLDIYFAILGAFKTCLFKIPLLAATRKRIISKKIPTFKLVNSSNELLKNCDHVKKVLASDKK